MDCAPTNGSKVRTGVLREGEGCIRLKFRGREGDRRVTGRIVVGVRISAGWCFIGVTLILAISPTRIIVCVRVRVRVRVTVMVGARLRVRLGVRTSKPDPRLCCMFCGALYLAIAPLTLPMAGGRRYGLAALVLR